MHPAARALALALIIVATAATVAAEGEDTQPPSTSLGLEGPVWVPEGASAPRWISPDTRISLAAWDGGAGVAATYYRVNGGPAHTYTGPFHPAAATGPYNVTFWSEDTAGNVEDARTAPFHLDATAPTIALTDPPEGAVVVDDRVVMRAEGPWQVDLWGVQAEAPALLRPADANKTVVVFGTTLRVDYTDAGAGVDHVRVVVDGETRRTLVPPEEAWYWDTTLNGEGRDHTVTVVATDHLGHTASHTRVLTSWHPWDGAPLPFRPVAP